MLKVIHVSSMANKHVYVEFDDGRKGEVDILPFMTSPYFKALENDAYFSKVSIFFSGIGWPDGQDLGPDTLSAELKPSQLERKVS